ncbi:MAG: serine hydrolase [Chloroflexi bacterium]|nr:serine hydrolase [Chloroflexota bacterium]
MTTLSGRGSRSRRRLPLIPLLSAVMLFAAIGLFLFELVNFSQQQDRLAAGVSIASVPVGGLPLQQAAVDLQAVYAQPLVLYYNDSPILLEPSTVGFRLSEDTMLAQASAVGDTQLGFWARYFNYLTRQQLENTTVDVPLAADYQRGLLQQFLDDIARRYDRPAGAAGYDVQTLTTFAGTPGYALDIARALESVDTALRNPNQRTVVLPIGGQSESQANINTLRDLIIGYLDSQGFVYDGQTTVASVFIMDLQTGEEVNLLGDVAFSAASTIKVPIMIDYYRTLAFSPSSDEAWLLANSLLCSNNYSSNLIMQIIGGDNILNGLQDVNNTARYLGARNTYIAAPLVFAADQQPLSIPIPSTTPNPNFDTDPDAFNQTTTEDLGTLFSLIYDCAYYGSGLMAAYPNGEFTQNECRQMLNLMSANNLERLLQGGIPENAPIAHKNGWLENVHGDAGIVFPPNGRNYVIAVFVWEDTDFFSFERAWPLIEGISRAAWNYFSGGEESLLTARTDLPPSAQECVPNFLPASAQQTDLNTIGDLTLP